jgi:hypothetical protein
VADQESVLGGADFVERALLRVGDASASSLRGQMIVGLSPTRGTSSERGPAHRIEP